MGHFTVSLNGRSYRLRCGDGEEGRLAELATYVERRVDDIAMASGQYGDERLLLMVTLLLADELLDLKARIAEAEATGNPRVESTELPLFPVPDAGFSAEPPEEPGPVVETLEPAAEALSDLETGDARRRRLSPARGNLEARLAEARGAGRHLSDEG